MTKSGIPTWRKQAALFAAGASGLIGLGVLLVVILSARESARPPEKSPPTPSRTEGR